MTKAQKAEYKVRRMVMLLSAHAITMKGVCPTCGTKLYRNLSLSGWWQCGHYGAVGFQKAPGPNCDFQIFYDPTPAEHEEVLAREQKVETINRGRAARYPNDPTPDYAARVQKLEAEGLTTSDAQAVVDAEIQRV